MLYALIAAIFVSSLSLIGSIFTNTQSLLKYSKYFVALAAGTLVADVFMHLLPEATENGFTLDISLVLIGSIVSYFVLEGVFRWHHSHSTSDLEHHKNHPTHLGKLSLVADVIHNFVDGLAIAASFAIDFRVGIITTIAIALHEIPQEIANFGVLLHSGFTRKNALLWNLISGLFAVLGVFFFVIFGGENETLKTYLSVFAAGSLLYIALADMIPEVHENNHKPTDISSLLWFLLGIIIIAALSFIEPILGGHSH